MNDETDQSSAQASVLFPGPTHAVDWWALSPAARTVVLEPLRRWVARLVAAYDLDSRTVPSCWEEHEGAVRLLDALHRSYLLAADSHQDGEALVGWHHNLDFVRGQLRVLFSTCGCSQEGGHVPAHVPAWAQKIIEEEHLGGIQ